MYHILSVFCGLFSLSSILIEIFTIYLEVRKLFKNCSLLYNFESIFLLEV